MEEFFDKLEGREALARGYIDLLRKETLSKIFELDGEGEGPN